MQPLKDVEEQTGMEMSVTSIDNSLENEQKEGEGAIGKFLSETCGHTLGPIYYRPVITVYNLVWVRVMAQLNAPDGNRRTLSSWLGRCPGKGKP